MTALKKWLTRLDRVQASDPKWLTLTNEDLAKKLKMSERQLFREMKKSTGLSPQQYLRQYRLQQSMVLLKTGQSRTVNEAAFAVGYSNVSYFIHQFERKYGKKPLRVLRESGWR